MNPTYLKERAVKKEIYPHRIDYSEEQMDSLREKLTESVIQEDNTLEAFKEVRRGQKVILDDIRNTKRELLKAIRLRYKEEDREVYLVPDFEQRVMEYFDTHTGECLFTRRLRPEEFQTNIISAIAVNS